MYICGGESFETLELAMAFADRAFKRTGIILGIEKL